MAQEFKNPSENPYANPVEKTNWALYTLTIVISFLFLTLLNLGLSISAPFLSLKSLTTFYISISIVSIIIGIISAFALNKVAKSNMSFFSGGLIASILSATINYTYLSIHRGLEKSVSGLVIESIDVSLLPTFNKTPNPFLTGILMIIFFNVTFLILSFKKLKK